MTTYTVSHAYKLGDYYKDSYQWLAAELCYALPSIKDHSYNSLHSQDIVPDKLEQFLEFRNANIKCSVPHKSTDIPTDASRLLKSFYSLWLNNKIKKDLIKRSQEHTSKRCETIIRLFKQVTSSFDNIGDLDISWIEKDVLTKHHQKIHHWKGPSFTKLQYKKNSTKLTVVMEYKDYRNRCMNSQEDWFKKYDGIFFAQCLEEIVQTLEARLSCNEFALTAMTFAKELLFCKIQFPLAAARLLLPAGTLFGCNALQDVLMKFHSKLNAKRIRQQSASNKSRDYHNDLLQICQREYTRMISRHHTVPIANGEPELKHMTEQDAYNHAAAATMNHTNTNQWDICSGHHYYNHESHFNEYMPHYQPQPMFDPNMAVYTPQSCAMNGDTGSVISICTECGEQQCLCSTFTDHTSTIQSMNLNDGHRLFQATNFPHGMHRNLRPMQDNTDRHQRVSLHIDAMRHMPFAPPIFGNTHSNSNQQ